MRWPKPSSCCRATFPPQVETTDQGHGRLEVRRLWSCPIRPGEIGFAGASQLIRVQRHWEGRAKKPEVEVRFAVVSLLAEQAGPARLLSLARGHWSIENRRIP